MTISGQTASTGLVALIHWLPARSTPHQVASVGGFLRQRHGVGDMFGPFHRRFSPSL